MAINDSLITGAGVAASKFTDIGGAFSKGVAKGKYAVPTLPEKRQAIKTIDTQVKGYIDSLDTDMDLVGLSSQEQTSVRGFLDSKRMEFAELATQLAQTDATSPYYSELKSKMNGIKNSFVGLGKQINNFKKRKVEYLDDFDNGRLSKGNSPEAYAKAAKAYAGGALSIDNNGELYVITDGGKEITKYSEIKDPFLKSFDVAGKIADQSLKLHNAGVPLNEPKKDLLRNDLKTLLSETGALESIVEDGLISGQPLNVDLDMYETREEAINDVTEMILKGYEDTANSAYKTKLSKTGLTSQIDNKNTYSGYNKNTEEDKKLANLAWAKSEEALKNAVAAINNDNPELANSILNEHKEGIHFSFYTNADAYAQRNKKSSYYIKPEIDLKTGDSYIVYKRGTEGSWKRIKEDDFNKIIEGTSNVSPSNKPDMG